MRCVFSWKCCTKCCFAVCDDRIVWLHLSDALLGCRNSFLTCFLLCLVLSRFVSSQVVASCRLVSCILLFLFLCCCFLLVNGLAWCRFCLPSLVMSCRVVSFIVLFWYVLFPIVLSRFALLCCVVASLVVFGLASRSVLYASLGGFIWL